MPQEVRNKNPAYRINRLDEDHGEIILYGDVLARGTTNLNDPSEPQSIAPERFEQDLKNLSDVKEILVRVNSCGGDLDSGIGIYNALVSIPARKVVRIDGMAASSASVIAMAGDEVQVYPGSIIMIHGISVCMGEGFYNLQDLNQETKSLESFERAITAIYAAKTGLQPGIIKSMIRKETWMTGQEAIDLGFADTMITAETFKSNINRQEGTLYMNGITHDLSRWKCPFLGEMKGADMAKNKYDELFGEEEQKINKAKAEDDPEEMGDEEPDEEPEEEKENSEDEEKECKCKKNEVTLDKLKAQYPDLIGQLINQAKAEEQARIMELEEIGVGLDAEGREIVQGAKFSEKRPSAAKVALAVMKGKKAQGSNSFLDAIRRDRSGAQEVGAGSAQTPSAKVTEADSSNEVHALMKNRIERKKGGRR